jgi:hypothetical protein
LSRKVGKKLLLYSKQHPSIAQILFKVVWNATKLVT